MATGKETILWRVRRATRDVPGEERPEDVPVERGYRTEDDAPRGEIVDRFAENVAEYEATVHRVAEADLPARIEEILENRGLRRLVVPPLLPEAVEDLMARGRQQDVPAIYATVERGLARMRATGS